ncbi:MAG: hypothetical protein KKE69_06255 [Alphaproteobacteria bacterium]|nr:hypothetical protein [Alphaproteobacteria bacterium]
MDRSTAPTLLATFALAACNSSGDYFSVANANDDVGSAEVHICDKVVKLPKRAERFSEHIDVDCEGSGKLKVLMEDGNEVTCIIGYVTPGASQHWGYEIKEGVCQSDGIAI